METTTIENSNETIILTLSKNPTRLTLDVTRKHDARRHVAHYAVGGEAAYDGFNLVYVGIIVSIGAKTVTIRDRVCGDRKRRLTFEKFAFWNRDTVAQINVRNAEESRYI